MRHHDERRPRLAVELEQELDHGVAGLGVEAGRGGIGQRDLVLAPVMLSIIWGIDFKKQALDTDKLIATQIDMLLAHIKA